MIIKICNFTKSLKKIFLTVNYFSNFSAFDKKKGGEDRRKEEKKMFNLI